MNRLCHQAHPQRLPVSLSIARLDGLSVHIFAVPDLEDRYLMTPIVNEVNDVVLSLPYAVAVSVTSEFFRAKCPGISGKRLNALDDTLTVCFCA